MSAGLAAEPSKDTLFTRGISAHTTIPCSIRQFVGILIVLIVREAHRIGAHVPQQIEILRLIRLGNGPALERSVLMHGRALQEKMLAVEQKTVVGIDT